MRVQHGQRLRDRARDVGRVHPEHPGASPGRVRERSEDVEDRARAELASHRRGVLHGRVVQRREHESEPERVDRLGDPLGRLLEVEPERLEHVRGAGDGAHRAVTVLRDRRACRGGDDRRGRGDVERARAVAARPHDVDDVRPRRVHGQHVGAHRLGTAGDLVGALPLRAQRHEEAADLRRRRLPGHDLAHHLARLGRGRGRGRREASGSRPGSPCESVSHRADQPLQVRFVVVRPDRDPQERRVLPVVDRNLDVDATRRGGSAARPGAASSPSGPA